MTEFFHYALNPTGFLVLGTSETVGKNADLFSLVDKQHKIYTKEATVTRLYPRFRAEGFSGATAAPAKGKVGAHFFRTGFQKEANRLLLDRYVPVVLLVNENLEILQFLGRTSRYLDLPPGEVSFNLLWSSRSRRRKTEPATGMNCGFIPTGLQTTGSTVP